MTLPRLVGLVLSDGAQCNLVPSFDDATLYLHSLHADPRGHGHGSALIRTIQANAGPGRSIVLQCAPELVAWYQRLGFTEIEPPADIESWWDNRYNFLTARERWDVRLMAWVGE